MRQEEFNRRAKSGHFHMGKERACSSSRCHDVSSLGRSDLPMPALGFAVPVNKGRRWEGKGRNRSCVLQVVVEEEKISDRESTDETRPAGLRSTGERARVYV